MHTKASRTSSITRPIRHRWHALALLVACAFGSAASAHDAPIDPWTDAGWRVGLSGLSPSAVRSVRWTEQLHESPDPEAAPVSQRTSRLQFDDRGRLAELHSERQRRGERDERRGLRYQWGPDARLQRIDEAGSAWRMTIKYDAAGREVERVSDDGKSNGRVRERRSYHASGALKSIDTDTQGGAARTLVFDPLGRPVKLTERDPKALRVTQVRYPTPLIAVHDDSGASLARGALRKWSREVTYRVRQADELLVAVEPAQPLSRREVRDGRLVETQTEFDDGGRILLQRVLDGERVRCVTEWQYHASGTPLATRSRQPASELRCAESPDLDVEIEVDAVGNWVRQVQHHTLADGRRVRVAEHTREIEYR
jgi:hypothetical protein